MSLRNDKERCEDASDVWQTYKDYVKKKRDYKREWRRQKKEESGRGSLGMVRDRGGIGPGMPRKRSTIPAHSVRVPRSPQVVEKLSEEEQNFLELDELDGHTGMGMDQMALVMEEIPSPEHLMVSDNDQVVYETEDQVENEETETDEQEEELLEEIASPVQELESSEPVQYVGDPGQEISEEDLLFLTRWDAVSAKIASVPDVEKRSRYLLIIEGLVNEACRP